MSEQSPIQILLNDPLSSVTRKARRSLLAIATIGIAIAKVSLVPTRISALGIEFSQTQSSSLMIVLGIVVLYFLSTFLVYAWTDLAMWRTTYDSVVFEDVYKDSLFSAPQQVLGGEEREAWDREETRKAFYQEKRVFYSYFARPATWARFLVDFVVPILVGAYGVIVLFGH